MVETDLFSKKYRIFHSNPIPVFAFIYAYGVPKFTTDLTFFIGNIMVSWEVVEVTTIHIQIALNYALHIAKNDQNYVKSSFLQVGGFRVF